MKIIQIEVGPMQNLCYIISSNSEAVIIDPGFEPEKILEIIKKEKLNVKYILLTHAHFDHIRAIPEIQKKLKVEILCSSNENLKLPHKNIFESEEIKFGKKKIKVIETPGHSRGSVCFLIDNYLFTGDTLFYHNYGRTDLPEGNEKELINSLKKLFKLPKETIVYPGHDYGAKSSTIGEEEKFFEKKLF
jgi:hydroxyacylglutathione hydrolase